jgi:hypothetical protein
MKPKLYRPPSPHPLRNVRSAAAIACFEALESRQLMSVDVRAGGDGIDANSQAGNAAKQNFGAFLQGSPGEARSIRYTLMNHTADALHITGINIPAGFQVTSGPAANQLLNGGGEEVDLVIRLNKNSLGHHEGNVVIHTDDGESFTFEITGDVRGSYDLGPVAGRVVRSGSLAYYRQSDYSGSAIIEPGKNVYAFSLASASDVDLDLQKLATGDQFDVSMNVFRDANADGVLQVSEEQPVMAGVEVNGFGQGDGVHSTGTGGTLAAGRYLMVCETADFLPEFSELSVNYRFTMTAASLGAPAIQVRQASNATIADGDLAAGAADGTDFGAATVGSLARRDFVIKNTGDAPLQLSPAAFLSANDGFSIDAGLPSTLAPGGTARLGLRLLTASAGHKAAQVVIPTNVPGVGQFNFAVAGDVSEPQDTDPAPATPPTATLLSAPKLTKTGGKNYAFTVRYADADRVDAATINKNDLTVTGPGGFAGGVKVASMKSAKKGRRLDVVYRVAGPGGTWNRPDNGQYAVALNGGQVADKLGATAPAASLGTFTVKIPKGATPAMAIAPAATFSRVLVADDFEEPLW